MFCHVAQRTFSDFSESVDTAAFERRLPYMGTFELTHRCNQACCHCYCNLGVNDRRKAEEMPTREVFRLLDEASDAGCFWLLLTGGEVLVREDFRDIYVHAKKRGMMVQVFTNATLINDGTASLFADLPPLGIDISIYGSCPAVHDVISRVPGSFQATEKGIGFLRKHKVGFSLKTILMTLNHADLENMRAFAGALGAEFRYDTLICPRLDGSMSPARYRLSAEAMVDMDMRDDGRHCKRIFDGFWNVIPDEPPVCGAALFAFNINPYGVLSPCTMFRSFQYPLKGVLFENAWRSMVREFAQKRMSLTSAQCRSCSMMLICSNCPAWSELENGSIDARVGYICEYARCLEKRYFQNKEGAPHAEKTLSKA